ncbi:hypothetical protein V2J09_013785 [Rumex salicifolius]
MVSKNFASIAIHGMMAPTMMVFVQVSVAGANIFFKLASLDGMNLSILVAYRFLFAAAFISPLAYFIERGSLGQNLYVESIVLTSAMFASAMTNLIPAITFILAICFRLEKLRIKSTSGIAKVLGTILGIVGAMVLTFYKGFEINLWPALVNTRRFAHVAASSHPQDGNPILGSLSSLACTLSYASWLIIQAKMSKNYPCYYSSTALMSIMGAIQALVYAVIVDHDWKHWKLGWNIRLLTVTYAGVVGSGICILLISWCVKLKGPLYVSIFNPLMLIVVAIAGVLGTVIIVVGLYAVLWGITKELKKLNKLTPAPPTSMKIAHQTANDTSTTTTTSDSKKIDGDENMAESRTLDGSVAIEIETLNKEIVVGVIPQLK